MKSFAELQGKSLDYTRALLTIFIRNNYQIFRELSLADISEECFFEANNILKNKEKK